MCIAILNRPTGKKITKEQFEECYRRNGDGTGIMWAENGHIMYSKELGKPDAIWKMYNETRDRLPGINIVLHFRIGTSGGVTEDNIHPFFVSKYLGFVHNGMIDINVKDFAGMSDTRVFNQLVLQKFYKLDRNFFNKNEFKYTIQLAIRGSKLIFLDHLGEANIFNEDAGKEDDGNWFSNESYKPYAVYTYKVSNYQSDAYTGKFKDKGKEERTKSSYYDKNGRWIIDGEYFDSRKKQWVKAGSEDVPIYCADCKKEQKEYDMIGIICRKCYNYNWTALNSSRSKCD